MAKKLDSLALRNDDKGKQIRCLVIENEVTGMVTKVRDYKKFDEVIASTHPDYLTKVYEPTIEERDGLLELIKKNIVTDENGETSVDISEEQVLLTMLGFTDIEIDKRKNKQNLAMMKRIIEKPTAVFLSIKQELDVLILEVISMYHSMFNAYKNIPEEIDDLGDKIESLETLIKSQEEEKKSKEQYVKQLENKLIELEIETENK